MRKIIVKVKGGIGNQLFQYAFGKSLALEYKRELILDKSWYLYNRNPSLSFALDKLIENNIQIKYSFPLFKILNLFGCIMNFKEKFLSYEPVHLNDKYISNFDGYFQCEKYFINYRSEIIESICLPDTSRYDNIFSTNNDIVGIHIRRGDYTKEVNLKIHGLCNLSYYKKAINILKKKFNKLKFIIFTDDRDWVKRNFSLINKNSLIEIDVKSNDILELALFSKCHHFICANSTFSWWAAWLSTNKNKEVIVPKKWFVDSELNDATNIKPKSWISI